MTNSWARKTLAVAALATGAILFAGGTAQASEAAPVVEGGWSDDQNAGNICGNVMAHDSIVVNFVDCDATNVDDSWGLLDVL
ncbi:hypothetical protein LX16_3499 [Stackebrandtia albiflava]|uniref:Secreted protein n=1 Tax=Stackebrandtia albiflava TaxID=406432 RepID=A0A562V4G5_9ACTN|nr:hypothetical protein [Stackebrandtia albiflava]TWJ12735.1 hypothetical protein LX16_3499 [Stackebrandtia albiflava]